MNFKSIRKKLIKGFSKTGGRNNTGKITHFNQSKGHKKLYRKIDFKGIFRMLSISPSRPEPKIGRAFRIIT